MCVSVGGNLERKHRLRQSCALFLLPVVRVVLVHARRRLTERATIHRASLVFHVALGCILHVAASTSALADGSTTAPLPPTHTTPAALCCAVTKPQWPFLDILIDSCSGTCTKSAFVAHTTTLPAHTQAATSLHTYHCKRAWILQAEPSRATRHTSMSHDAQRTCLHMPVHLANASSK